jgi:hypothetical protein
LNSGYCRKCYPRVGTANLGKHHLLNPASEIVRQLKIGISVSVALQDFVEQATDEEVCQQLVEVHVFSVTFEIPKQSNTNRFALSEHFFEPQIADTSSKCRIRLVSFQLPPTHERINEHPRSELAQSAQRQAKPIKHQVISSFSERRKVDLAVL